MLTPMIGEMVHYVSYGTPGGEFASECRAAIVTDSHEGKLSLAVINPSGVFFHYVSEYASQDKKAGGSWHPMHA